MFLQLSQLLDTGLLWKNPSTHLVQASAPAPENLPLEHTEQLLVLFVSENLPLSHFVQLVPPLVDPVKEPPRHSVHSSSSATDA